LIARARTEPAKRVERARILLGYLGKLVVFRGGPSARAAPSNGPALRRAGGGRRPGGRVGRSPSPRQGADDHAGSESLVDIAFVPEGEGAGYPHELWTTRLLARHAREHGHAEGHPCLANLAQGTLCKILDQEEVKPHKVRYYLEKRDPEFAKKWPRCCASIAK
jgi:hypothetical protein